MTAAVTEEDDVGRLVYGAHSEVIEFEDRVLAHLQMVIVAKLRRNESFTFSWSMGQDRGGGHSTMWLHPAVALRFIYFGGRQPQLNREWVDELMQGANTANGLQLTPEPSPTS